MTSATLSSLIDDVEARAPSEEPLDLLSTASATAGELGELSDALLSHYVDRCRRSGLSWAEIGTGLGVTKQAVQKRFTPREGQQPGWWGRATGRAQKLVTDAAPTAARGLGHGWVGTEHLLLGLLSDPQCLAAVALERQGVTEEAVAAAVGDRLGKGTAPDAGPFTPRAWAALEAAPRHALGLGHNYIGTEHVLLALLGGVGGVAAEVLTDLGVTAATARASVVQLLRGDTATA